MLSRTTVVTIIILLINKLDLPDRECDPVERQSTLSETERGARPSVLSHETNAAARIPTTTAYDDADTATMAGDTALAIIISSSTMTARRPSNMSVEMPGWAAGPVAGGRLLLLCACWRLHCGINIVNVNATNTVDEDTINVILFVRSFRGVRRISKNRNSRMRF